MLPPKQIKIRIRELESEARALENQGLPVYAKASKKAAEELKKVLE